ncbi:MAG: TrkH family potassium uptake protein [Parvibaculales bacterium]
MPLASFLYIFGWGTCSLALIMLAPLLVALGGVEQEFAHIFLYSFLLTSFVGGALISIGTPPRGREKNMAAMLLSAVCYWLVLPLLAAIPFWAGIENWTITRAYFEAVSGLTTTGMTLLHYPEGEQQSILLWRAMLNWLGGAWTLFFGMAVFSRLGIGELVGRGIIFDRARKGVFSPLLVAIGWLYVPISILGIALLWVMGAPFFEAICFGLSAISTGGFSPISGGVNTIFPPLAELVLCLMMLFGAIGLPIHIFLFRGRFQILLSDEELRGFFIFLLLLFGIFLLAIFFSEGWNISKIFSAFVSAVSFISSTGFVMAEGAPWGVPVILLGIIALIGTMGLSTGGGVKLFRVLIWIKSIASQLRLYIFPHASQEIMLSGRVLSQNALHSLCLSLLLYPFCFALLMGILGMTGVDFYLAWIGLVSALGNMSGIFLHSEGGAHWLMQSNSSSLSVLGLAMVLGRIEFLAFLALLNPAYWRR